MANRTDGREPSSVNAGTPSMRWRFSATSPVSTGSRPCARWQGSRRRAIGLLSFRRLIPEAKRRARERISAIDRLALQCGELSRVEYDFLYDKPRHLLAIGYNVSERRRDSGFYDLLASEARLCSFVAIAQGQLPQESWFALGRLLTAAGGEPILLSWSGSMFEYLMPLLVMPTYENTLIDQTCKAAVGRQIEYGKQRGVPWGMSESGYNMVDVRLNYQYRAFGVPGLGLKRGLASDLVVAPYASALALMVAPEEACRNLQRLGGRGVRREIRLLRGHRLHPFTTTTRSIERGRPVLHGPSPGHEPPLSGLPAPGPSDAEAVRVGSAVPGDHAPAPGTGPEGHGTLPGASELSVLHTTPGVTEMPVRIFGTPDTPVPEVQLLSNGRYHVMVTNAGGGYSRWKDIAVTRWREDGTCDNWGTFCYIRDVASGRVLVDRLPADAASSRRSTRRSSRRRGRSSAAATTNSTRTRKSPFRPKTTSRCAGSTSSTAPRHAGRSKSRVTPKWFLHRLPRTRCIRRSATSSSRPRSFPSGRRSSAPAGPAPSTSRRRGCFI